MSTATSTTYTLDQYKTDAENNLNAQRDRKKQIADINYQKLMKYLPTQQKANGTAGMAGLSESAALAAAADYQNAVSAAESEYNEAHTDLLNNYRLEKEAEQDKLYDEIMTKIDSGEFNTIDELDKYLYGEDGKGGITQGLTQQQQQLIQGKYNFYAASSEQQTSDAKYYETHNKDGTVKPKQIHTKDVNIGGVLVNMVEGNNFKINGYKVELGELVTDTDPNNKKTSSTLPSDILSKTSDGQVFEYDGQLYYRSSITYGDGSTDDKIFMVRGRGGSETDDYKNALAEFTK